jgi:hypothetical protein
LTLSSAAAIAASMTGSAPARRTYVPGEDVSASPQRPSDAKRTAAAAPETRNGEVLSLGGHATIARSAATTLSTTVVTMIGSPR